MKVNTHVKAGGRQLNHNETIVRDAKSAAGSPKGLRVKTHVKPGRRAGGGV